MARVFTAKAAKDYPAHGIVKGEVYFYWTTGFRGRKQMSKTKPKPSQTTGNEKLSQLYAAGEQFDIDLDASESPGDITDALNAYAEQVREVQEMYQESFENMPEGLQQGDTGQQLESNAEDLDSFATELEDAATDIETMDHTDFIDEDRVRAQAMTNLEEAFDGDGEYEENDDDVDAEVERIKALIVDFDDLDASEQDAFMEEAKGKANEPSCPL